MPFPLFNALACRPSQKCCTNTFHPVYELKRDEITVSRPWLCSVWEGCQSSFIFKLKNMLNYDGIFRKLWETPENLYCERALALVQPCHCTDELSFEVYSTVHTSLLYGTCGEHSGPLTHPHLQGVFTLVSRTCEYVGFTAKGNQVADGTKFAKSVHVKIGKLSWSICVGSMLSRGSLEVDSGERRL